MGGYIKSPMNYIGGKYRILPQLMDIFPKMINTAVDLFAGGLNVALNLPAKSIVCNDINNYVIELYRSFIGVTSDEVLEYVNNQIGRYSLSKTNEEGYLSFRNYYNKTKHPWDLFILMSFSFNHQIRFNTAHEYNNPFGRNRSSFNASMRTNLIRLIDTINRKNMKFHSCDFTELDLSFLGKKDFLYADPPYLITTGSYNDGKRGFKGWGKMDEAALLELLDKIDSQGAKFALSNVLEHKGNVNGILLDWSKKYKVYPINCNYNNSNYQTTASKSITREVLIANY